MYWYSFETVWQDVRADVDETVLLSLVKILSGVFGFEVPVYNHLGLQKDMSSITKWQQVGPR